MYRLISAVTKALHTKCSVIITDFTYDIGKEGSYESFKGKIFTGLLPRD